KPGIKRLCLFRCDPRYVGLELGIERACFLPAQHVERFDELANPVDLGAEQAEFDDLFVVEVLGEIGVDLVFVHCVLALFKQLRVTQRCLLTRREVLTACIIETGPRSYVQSGLPAWRRSSALSSNSHIDGRLKS